MSRIEEYSRPLLTPLVLGERRSLSPQDQEIAATWGFKTILMLQFLNRADQREIPRDQYRWFFQHQTPPSAARISLGHFSGPLVDGTYWHSAYGPPPVGSGTPTEYQVTFNVGRLLYHAFGRTDKADATKESTMTPEAESYEWLTGLATPAFVYRRDDESSSHS